MVNSHTSTSTPIHPRAAAPRGPRPARLATVTVLGIAAATAANLGLYAIGLGTDATLRVDPGLGEPNHLVTGIDVAWKTALPLAAGALVLRVVSPRSHRARRVILVAGAAVALGSVPFVIAAAHDPLTGAVLAGMHTISGVAYLVIGRRRRPSWA